jgi:hypothetical protein
MFRGARRVVIARKDVPAAEAKGGALHVTHAGGTAVFERGAAAKWAEKIRDPKGLLDKLGVKPGARGAVAGVDDPDFRAPRAL